MSFRVYHSFSIHCIWRSLWQKGERDWIHLFCFLYDIYFTFLFCLISGCWWYGFKKIVLCFEMICNSSVFLILFVWLLRKHTWTLLWWNVLQEIENDFLFFAGKKKKKSWICENVWEVLGQEEEEMTVYWVNVLWIFIFLGPQWRWKLKRLVNMNMEFITYPNYTECFWVIVKT